MITEAILSFLMALSTYVLEIVSLPLYPLDWISSGLNFLNNYVWGYVYYFVDPSTILAVIGGFVAYYVYVTTWGIIRFLIGRS